MWLSEEILPEGNFSAVPSTAFPGPLIQDGPFVTFRNHLACTVCQALSALASDIDHFLSHPIYLVSSPLPDGTVL